MPFDPDAYLAGKPQPEPAAPPPFDPDAYIAGKPQPSAAAAAPGIFEYGKEIAKQIGIGAVSNVATAIQGLAAKDEESRRLEAAIGAVQAGEEPGVAMGKPPVPALPLPQEPIYKAGEALQAGTERFLQPKGILPPLGQEVARGVGSVAGNILTSLVPGGAALIPLQGIGEAAQTAVQKGASPEQSERAAQLGTIAGMTDFVDLLLPSLGGSTGKALGLISRVGLRALEGALVEGGQEGLQQYIQNLITRGVYKPDQDVMEDVPRSALIGAIVGGGTSAVIGGHAHPPETIPPGAADVTAAGVGIVQPPGPLAPPSAVQGELPLGPPQAAQTELPLGPPITLTPGQMAASAAGIKNYVAGLSDPTNNAEPSINPLVERGHALGGLIRSEVLPSDPIEMRSQDITVPGQDVVAEEITRRQQRGAERRFAAAESDEDIQRLREWARRNGIDPNDIPQLREGELRDVTPEAMPKITPAGPTGLTLATKYGQIVTGQTVATPKGFSVKTIHSTNVGNFVPNLSVTHLKGEPVASDMATALIQMLTRIIPDMPIHFVLRSDMNRVSPGADGVYFSSVSSMELPTSQQGPIFIPADVLQSKERLTEVVLHESTHAATSNVIRKDPEVRGRIRLLMNEAERHVQNIPEEKRPYGFTNEREFIAESFNNPDFQNFLLSKGLPQRIARQLGLEGKPSLFRTLVDTVRNALGLESSGRMMSLLEATIRVGGETMTEQQRQTKEMQNKFNSVEPALEAVPRQDETRGIYDALRGLKDHIDSDYSAELVRQAGYADKMNLFYKYMVHAFQLGELNPRLVPLQQYLAKMREAAVDESKINDARIRVTKDWINLGRNMSERLVGLIDDITNMTYRTPIEVQRGIGRKPTQVEFNNLVRKHGVNQAGLQVLQKINKLFDTFLDLSADLARQEALKIQDPVARANAVAAVNQNVTNLKSRPYFPFMRYGRHVVTVQNQAGRVIHREHFERRGLKSAVAMQKAAMARLERAFPAPLYTVKPDILSESSGPMVGMPGMLLDMMAQKLNLSPAQLKALDQLKFQLSPAESFRHRFQNKSYTQGYSKDFRRSFAQYFFHGAKWYVKAKYADGMRNDIKAVQNGALSSLTPVKRVQIAKFLEDHLENQFLNPKQDFTTFKAGLVFYTLSYVPLSAVVNMSQVPMVSLPHLSGKFGDFQASKALTKAIGTGRNYFRKGNLASMTAPEARALDYAIKTGRLDQSMGSELAAWGQGGNLGGFEGNVVAQTLHSMVEKGMWMFSIAEKWNRRVTFAAARELALAQPNNAYVKETLTKYQDELKDMMAKGFPQHEAEAILVASHVVDQTQFMATPTSRPRFMRGKLGSLFLYKRYIQGLLMLTLNNKRDFMPRFLIIALLMGGLHSIPGYDDLAEIARVLGYWLFGKDFSADRELRRLMRSLGTDEHISADQVLHGGARIGFGVPWLLNMLGNAAGQSPTFNQRTGAPSGPDLSRSLGAGPILPVELGKVLGPPITDPAQAFGEQSARAGGVMGQLAFNFYRAIASKDNPQDFKRWELMMPRAAKDLSSAYRAYSEEKIRGKNDTAIVRFDTRDPEHLGEIIGMTGGFQPRRLTARWDELRDQSEQIKFQDTMRGMILDQWAAAVRSQDPEEREKMRVATQEFNANLPQWARGMALTSDTIQRSVGMRLKTQVTQEAGFAIQRGRIPLIQEIQSLHPESVVDVRKVR